MKKILMRIPFVQILPKKVHLNISNSMRWGV